ISLSRPSQSTLFPYTTLFRSWHPQDDEAAQTLASCWCHRLKHEGGAVVLEALRQRDVAHATPLLQNAHRELLVYFENQVHRMDRSEEHTSELQSLAHLVCRLL